MTQKPAGQVWRGGMPQIPPSHSESVTPRRGRGARSLRVGLMSARILTTVSNSEVPPLRVCVLSECQRPASVNDFLKFLFTGADIHSFPFPSQFRSRA